LHGVPYALRLRHQLLVHVQTTRGVDDQCGVTLILRTHERSLRDLDRVAPRFAGFDVDSDLGAELDELRDRGRTLEVGSGEERFESAPLEVRRQLRCCGRLTGPLKADEQDDGRRLIGELERPVLLAEETDELVVDDLDQLLAGRDRGQDRFADRFRAHPLEELADDGQGDVGFEERETDLAQSFIHIRFGELSLAAETGERSFEPLGETFEHGPSLAKAADGQGRRSRPSVRPSSARSPTRRGGGRCSRAL
jgi:hypothetical protein